MWISTFQIFFKVLYEQMIEDLDGQDKQQS